MLLVDQIKLAVLRKTDDIAHITHWLNLQFLSRVIIIFTEEQYAEKAYQLLRTEFPTLAITRQENLLLKSKLSEQLELNRGLQQFQEAHAHEIVEPTPSKFGKRDMIKLGINTSDLDLKETKTLYSPQRLPLEPQSPTITLNSF